MRNYTDLTGRLIAISGGAGALGAAVVGGLLDQGAEVAVGDLLPPELAADLLPSSSRLSYFSIDVSDPKGAQRFVDGTIARHGRSPDVVCCHAGMVAAHPVHEYPIGEFDDLMRLNVRGSFLLAQTSVRRWLEDGASGHLIFTTSWVQETPWPSIAPYNASKAAVRQLARCFARELADRGIRANAFAPGMVAAGMAKRAWDTDPDYRHRAERAIPLGRLQPLESVVNAFLFLASDLAAYMTGSTLVVDGGASLYPMDS